MNNKKLLVEQEPNEEQAKTIEEIIVILDSVGLELIGTRPKDR